MSALDVLHVSRKQFARSPQIGTPCSMEWIGLAAYLSRPSIGEAKDAAGAYSPALYHDNVRRKANLISIGALVVDIDKNGDVDEAADVLEKYAAIVHETFSSTVDAPRCRIVLALTEPIDASTYEAIHRIVRATLARAGIPADEGAKDASRLSYVPVRRPGTGYRFRVVDGAPLDARAVLAAQPPPPPPRRRPVTRPVAPHHRDRYLRAALARAADEVLDASEGARHYALCRVAYSLSRLELSSEEIESALLPSFVAAAGERRAHEGVRTIRDAVRARRGAT